MCFLMSDHKFVLFVIIQLKSNWDSKQRLIAWLSQITTVCNFTLPNISELFHCNTTAKAWVILKPLIERGD